MLRWPPRSAALLVLFSACTSDSGPPPHTATSPIRPRAEEVPNCQPSDHRLAERLLVAPRPGTELELACEQSHPCQEMTTLVLENPGPNRLSVESMVLEHKGSKRPRPQALITSPVALAVGARTSHTIEVTGGVTFAVTMLVEECGQRRSLDATFSTTAEVLRRSMAECAACNGEYGPHGLRGIPSCVCGTSDAGRPCDGGDCEGLCLLDAHPQCDGVPCRVAPLGQKGRCSEYKTVFGCRTRLGKDRRIATLCLD